MHNIAHIRDLPEPIDRSQLSVYQQGWWHDIIAQAPGYREIIVVRDNKVAGALTYFVSSPFGLYRIIPWTHLSGPILAPGLSRNERKDVIIELVRKVPRSIPTRFMFDADCPNALLFKAAFHNAGFSMGIERNFRTPPDTLDALERMNIKNRKKIKSAMKYLEIVDVEPEIFMQFYADNIKARGKVPHTDLDIARRLLSEGFKRQQVRLLATQSKTDGAFHAALAVAEDQTRAFGWLLSYAPDSHYAATRCLFIEAIKYAKEKGLVFDADGAPSEGHVRNYQEILRMPHEVDRFVVTRFGYPRWLFYKSMDILRPVCAQAGRKAPTTGESAPTRPPSFRWFRRNRLGSARRASRPH